MTSGWFKKYLEKNLPNAQVEIFFDPQLKKDVIKITQSNIYTAYIYDERLTRKSAKRDLDIIKDAFADKGVEL